MIESFLFLHKKHTINYFVELKHKFKRGENIMRKKIGDKQKRLYFFLFVFPPWLAYSGCNRRNGDSK